MSFSVITRRPLRCGWGNRKLIVRPSLAGASILSMRSICLSLRLRLRGLGVLGAEAVGELLELLDLALLVLVGGELLLLLRLALAEIVVVVAAVADQLALADLDDAADELVQELAVVRDQQDRAGVGLQVVLEPQQRLEVEMVGRLVEQQQVRLLDEQAREVRAHHPAAAHRAQRAGRSPARGTPARRGSSWPSARAGSRRARRTASARSWKSSDSASWPASNAFIRRWSSMTSGVMPGRQLEHGLVADRRGFLRQMADRRLRSTRHFARVRRVAPEDEREERGLARAVRADQPDAVLAVDLQRHVLEQHAVAERLGHS